MKKYLETNFIKFLVEKSKMEIQELPDEETNISNKEIVDEFINAKEIKKDEVQDETDNEEDLIEDLIKEYNQLQKKYKLKTNGLYNKR